MSIPKFTLFEHRLEEKYTAIVQELPGLVKALRLSNSLDDGDLNKIKKDVYSDLTSRFDLIDFEIKKTDISVQNQEYEFEKSVAGDIMGEIIIASLMSVTDYIKLYYAIYTVPYAGKIDALKYTTIYPQEEVYLTDHSGYFSLTVYSVKPIKESAEEIKHAKDRALDLITKNQEANKTYIKAKEDTLKDAIDREIDLYFKSGRDEISDNNLLL